MTTKSDSRSPVLEFKPMLPDAEGWSEWVNPKADGYLMQCCDCGLVHEMQFRVVRYGDGDECELVQDADMQPVFRARRNK